MIRRRRSARKTGPDAATRELVRWRDRDRCRRCGATTWQIHHRKPRGMGGSRDPLINDPSNLVLLCGSGTTGCHGWVEQHRTEARRQGWLVSQHADPRYQPIDHEGQLLFLTSEGKTAPETTRKEA